MTSATPLPPRRGSRFLTALLFLVTAFILLCHTRPIAAASPHRSFQIHDLPVLMVWGSPEQNGRIHGEVFRSQIQHLVKHVLYKKVLGADAPRLRDAALGYLKKGLARLPAATLQELRGLAQGAGLPLEDIFLLNFYAETILYPSCSLIGVTPSRAVDSQALVAHNLDWPAASGSPVILLADGSPGHIPYAALTLPGIPFPTMGINRAGLCVAFNAAFSIEPLPSDASFILPRMRQILGETENLPQAIRLLTRQARYHAWTVLLASAPQKRLNLLELGHSHWSARQPRDGVFLSTNHLAGRALASITYPPDAGSLKRLERLAGLTATKDKLSVHDLERFLLDPQVWDETVYSAVCVPGTLKLTVCPSPGRTYTPVDVGKILNSFPRQSR